MGCIETMVVGWKEVMICVTVCGPGDTSDEAAVAGDSVDDGGTGAEIGLDIALEAGMVEDIIVARVDAGSADEFGSVARPGPSTAVLVGRSATASVEVVGCCMSPVMVFSRDVCDVIS